MIVMNRKKRVLAILLAFVMAASLVFSVAPLGFAEEYAVGDIPEEYRSIIQSYYTLIYSDWYVEPGAQQIWEMGLCPLLADMSSREKESFGYCLEDINGDGSPELFFGVQDRLYADEVLQMFTLIDGVVYPLYTTAGLTELHLCDDGLLCYESVELEGSYAVVWYKFEKEGFVRVVEGVMETEDPSGFERYYYIMDENFDPERSFEITESEYREIIRLYMPHQQSIIYTPLKQWAEDMDFLQNQSERKEAEKPQKKKEEAAKPAESRKQPAETGSSEGTLYTHRVLKDPKTGIDAVTALIPDGWYADVSVDWGRVDANSPGLAVMTLTSPDSHAQIKMFSNQQYFDITANGQRYEEGINMQIFASILHYRTAEEFQKLGLESEQHPNARIVKRIDVSDDMKALVQEASRVKLQNNLGSASAAVGAEGTVAHNLYQDRNLYIEYFNMVTSARTKISAGRVSMDQISWNVPISFLFYADSEEAYGKYRDVFLNVMANSDVTMEFVYVNLCYGQQIIALIQQNLTSQAEAYLNSSAGAWAEEYERSSGYDSDAWANQWSDVIYERNEYTTTDGNTIKVDTKYDSVYQDGDRIYMGPDGLAPDNWTKLYPN